MRVSLKLLLLTALAACGAPGSDAVFDVRKNKAPATDTSAKAPVPPPAPRLVTRQYSGLYWRAAADTVQFQPCGMNVVFDVVAQGTAALQLRERYRFIAPWQGAKMFAVFRGAIVTDSVRSGGDSARSTPRTRFVVAGVDSMRARRPADCGGKSPS